MRHDTRSLHADQLKRLRLPVGVENARLALQVAVESGFRVSQPLIDTEAQGERPRDAHHLIQMVLLRSASILQLAEGTPHPNGASVHVPWLSAPDPGSIWGLVRAQYEAFATLCNIYTQHQGEEQAFLYSIWALAGLMNRAPLQEFLDDPMYAKYVQREDKEAYEALLAEIEVEKAKFKALSLFSSQTPQKQEELLKRITKGQFQFVFENGVPIWRGWHLTFIRAAQSDLFDTIYSSMSLWAHPSNAGVRRFGEMYAPSKEYRRQLEHALCFAALLLSMTIHEQIALFPECRAAFDSLPTEVRELLEHWNKLSRGNEN
mgnify:CR=1 FL=1